MPVKKSGTKVKKKPITSDSERVVAMSAANSTGQVAYQDLVVDEDPVKLRKAVQQVEYTTIASPEEVATGSGATSLEKGQGLYFCPPDKTTLGTFVGMKRFTTTFTNMADANIVIVGAFPKNWSGDERVTDTVEGFKLTIPPGQSRTVSAKPSWNFPMYPSETITPDVGSSFDVPLRAMVLRYFCHASSAWSEKYIATDVTPGSEGTTPQVTTAFKNVTAYKREDTFEYYTVNGAVEDESKQKLLGLFTFPNFADVGKINGSKPQPAFPKSGSLQGRFGNSMKAMNFYGNMGEINSNRAQIVNVSYDLRPANKIGLGVYPVNYYEAGAEGFGWGAYLYLCQWSQENIDNNTAPEPWVNTYTDPDESHNHLIEWEIPALAGYIDGKPPDGGDHYGNRSVCVGGRFKYWEQASAFVLWDYIRNAPVMIGSDYNDISGFMKFYVPKMISGPQSAITGVQPPEYKKDDKDFDATISWLTMLEIVSTIVEVLYVAGKALINHYSREMRMRKALDPIGYNAEMQAITKVAAEAIGDQHRRQSKNYRRRSVTPPAVEYKEDDHRRERILRPHAM